VAGFSRLSITDSTASRTLLPALLKRPDLTPALQTGCSAQPLSAPRTPAHRMRRRLRSIGAGAGRRSGAGMAGAGGPVGRDFATALTWIDAMPSSLAAQPRWRYWRARAVAATSGAAAAAPAYAEIAGLRDYYGYLAADKLNEATS